MDDWVVMVKTKHVLRKVIKITHRVLTALKLKMHPDKTYLGGIKKGFDFLGVHFGETPKISKISEENHRTRHALRYARNESPSSIGPYRERWTSWCNRLLKCCINGSQNSHGVMLEQITVSSGPSRRRKHEKYVSELMGA